MKTYRGSWEANITIDVWDDDGNTIEPSESDVEHVHYMISQGYTSGEIVHEEE